MGWLGYTEAESMVTDVNCVMIAMEGKLEMMYPEIKQAKVKGMAGARFRDFAKTHNARLKNKGG